MGWPSLPSQNMKRIPRFMRNGRVRLYHQLISLENDAFSSKCGSFLVDISDQIRLAAPMWTSETLSPVERYAHTSTSHHNLIPWEVCP